MVILYRLTETCYFFYGHKYMYNKKENMSLFLYTVMIKLSETKD